MTQTTASADSRRLRLARGGLTEAGRALRLRAGDVLLAVDGEPLPGDASALAARAAAAAGRPLALTFLRGAVPLTVLSATVELGRWETTTPERIPPAKPADPNRLHNWEILQFPDRRHDLHPLRPSLLALALPPVWLAAAQLWLTFATLTAALAVAFLAWPPSAGVVWLASALHLWRRGPDHVRAARMSEGAVPCAIVAARGEAEARAAYIALQPDARFAYAPRPAAAEAEPDAAAAAG